MIKFISVANILGAMKTIYDIIIGLFGNKKPNKSDNIDEDPKYNIPTINLPSVIFDNSLNWSYIIIHHSLSKDGIMRNFDALKKYHMSYRIDGVIVTKEDFESKRKNKIGLVFEEPWSDIGYHFVEENINGELVIIPGRPLSKVGSHCTSMNSKSIGICLCGNYDQDMPANNQYLMLAGLCILLMKKYKISINNIKMHNEYAVKSCPGKYFDKVRLIELIKSNM